MTQANHVLYGIHVHNRFEQAPRVQQLLTEYGSNIKTRLGLHETDSNASAASTGIILLEMTGDSKRVDELFAKLAELEGIDCQRMIFAHD